ncbi:MAG TPA: hypothetical protein VFR78_15595 [Pyrinomonadaceae bacterium]|nr:hypothetical protein [Pyrinomonadaceae bacterium]
MNRIIVFFACIILTAFPCIGKSREFAPKLKATLVGHRSQVDHVVFSSGGELVATADGDTTRVWNATGQLLFALDGTAPRFSPDGRLLLTIDNTKAKLWDATTGKLRLSLTGHAGKILSTAFSPDGTKLATGCEAGTVKIWDAGTGVASTTLWPVKKLPRYRIVSRVKRWANTVHVEFSVDLRFVLTRTLEVSRLWETATGKLIEEFKYPVVVATFSPDSNWLGINGPSDHAALLNLETRTTATPSSGETHFLNQIVFSPDGQTYVTGSGYKDYHATLIDVSTRRVTRTIPLAANWSFDMISVYLKDADVLSFHPSSKFLMGANQQSVKLWNTSTGQLVWETTEARTPAAFGLDGKLLATVGKDKKTVLLWEAESLR